MSLPATEEQVSASGIASSGRKFGDPEGFRWGSLKRPWCSPTRVASVLLGALLGLGFGTWWVIADRSVPEEISYSELLRAIDGARVESITVRPGQDVRGHWAVAPSAAVHNRGGEFVAAYPLNDIEEIVSRAEVAGVGVTLQSPPNPERFKEILAFGIQLILFGGIGYFLFMQLRGQRGGSGDIGKTSTSQTTFADVAGTQGASEELRELVGFLQRPGAFAAVGARVPKGALLVGPPGTGKTLLARAVAGEAGVPFFSISGSEVTGFLVGLGAHRVKSLFRKARKNGGVIFIDEIDALGGKRGRNQSHNEDDRTLNQLLVEMDGFSPAEGVVVIAATNREDDLDPALKRPGRFDRVIAVGLPTSDGREAILRLHATRKGIPLHPNVDLARLARLSPGSSGAELANLLNEAAIAAARDNATVVTWGHIECARDRMLLGKERVGFKAVEREWQTVAYHEAGHALAGVVFCPEDGLHKVTIQPRGGAMGVAYFSPEDDRHLYRRSYLEGQIVKGLAGRAAEEIVFGSDAITNGAQHDLQQVNGIARKMIYQLGMGTDTGLLIHDGQAGSLSATAHAQMDKEVRELLDRLYTKTREMLEVNRPALNALAKALLERETLEGDEAISLMEEHGLVRPQLQVVPSTSRASLAHA
jgi:cell division protease FtsH